MEAKTLNVIDSIGQGVHFYLAAITGARVHFPYGERPAKGTADLFAKLQAHSFNDFGLLHQ
jgi:hypothetical protein